VIFSTLLKVGWLDHMWQQSHNRVQDGTIPDSFTVRTCAVGVNQCLCVLSVWQKNIEKCFKQTLRTLNERQST